MTATLKIPEWITQVFTAYGSSFKLEQAVATRYEADRDWYAILFKADEVLEAVSFQRNMDGEWEVDDDGIGPFDSVRQFKTERLTNKWF